MSRANADMARTARRIAIGAFLVYAATGGGRITGSDEVTMFELSRALLHGAIAVPAGATLDGPDGRHYTKNSAGQAVLALPLTAAAEAAGSVSRLTPAKRELAVRFGVSFFNALVAALLLAAFYAAARALEIGAGASLAATLMLGFTTPLWVYAKSFMAEPLQALGLLLAVAGSALADRPGWRRAGAFGVLLAISVKLAMLPFALMAMLPLRSRPEAVRLFALALLAAMTGHLGYNVARFGTPFETGYGAQAGLSAYTTPLWVGLYGLLLSSGKGLAWFAPAVWLLPAGWQAARKVHGAPVKEPGRVHKIVWGLARYLPPILRPRFEPYVPPRRHEVLRRAAPVFLLMAGFAAVMYGMFEHWAGDGSFGPRYLFPFLPILFLLVAPALEHPSRVRRRLAQGLAIAGLLVQIGGVAIHFGAQMREAGDYPYTLPLNDPHFMSDSHFNPAYTPILGHWRMLVRNAGEHVHGEAPRLTIGAAPDSTAIVAPPSDLASATARLGVGEEDQRRLLHALDFWWLYATYAGSPALPLQAVAALLAVFGVVVLIGARNSARDERGS
jgi:hypothetical protein